MNTEEPSLVSVVVPVYNMEKYLRRCVDSIINQSYCQLEIILVDDGSTDTSPQICDNYSKTDSRVRVIHKKNGGLSDARNEGINIASGKYVTFVDSDDYISLNFVERMYQCITLQNADIAACEIENGRSEDSIEIGNKILSPKMHVWNRMEALKHMLLQIGITTSAWGKLYKASLFKGIRYPIGKLYEDLATTYKILDRVDKVVLLEDRLYYYFQRPGSIQNSSFNIKKLDELEIALELKKYVDGKYPQLETATANRLVSSCFHILFCINDKVKNKTIVSNIETIIKKYRFKLICERDVSKKVRLGCMSTYMGFKITEKIYFITNMRGKINF